MRIFKVKAQSIYILNGSLMLNMTENREHWKMSESDNSKKVNSMADFYEFVKTPNFLTSIRLSSDFWSFDVLTTCPFGDCHFLTRLQLVCPFTNHTMKLKIIS
jgi:hypothetical protein